jgi:hypothetical protein
MVDASVGILPEYVIILMTTKGRNPGILEIDF